MVKEATSEQQIYIILVLGSIKNSINLIPSVASLASPDVCFHCFWHRLCFLTCSRISVSSD